MSTSAISNSNVSDSYTTVAATKEKDKNTSVNNNNAAASNTNSADSDVTSQDTATIENKKQETTAAVYDKRALSADDRKTIVAQLKADQEKRQSQLADLVNDMLSKQTNAFGQANNMWQYLAKGQFTVDAETKKKAQEDISENGYWGVEKTSDRIVEFATALAGNDPKQLEKMRDAFLKGYKKAEKTWGGKLPDISQRTYDAVLDKFDKLTNPKTEDNTTTQNTSNQQNGANQNAGQNTNQNVTTTEDGTVIVKN